MPVMTVEGTKTDLRAAVSGTDDVAEVELGVATFWRLRLFSRICTASKAPESEIVHVRFTLP